MIKVYAQLRAWSRDVQLAIAEEDLSGIIGTAKAIEFTPADPNMSLMPILTLKPPAVQKLIDELWNCGYRPSEGSGSAGQLAAVKYHLEDMRKLVFEEK